MNKDSGVPNTLTVTFIRLVTLLTSSYHGEVNPLPYYWGRERFQPLYLLQSWWWNCC